MSCGKDIASTFRAQMKGHPPIVSELFENHGIDARYTGPYDIVSTMAARWGTGGNNSPFISTICVSGNTVDRQPENGGNGLGCQMNLSYTLNTSDRHAVMVANLWQDEADCESGTYQPTVGTIGYSDYKGINSQYVGEDKCIVEAQRNLIRRLTPLECERLQGFPDGWTALPDASDSARYKALGNSVAIPCVAYVLGGIAMAY